jgi:protein transport protein SEC24
MAVRTSAGLKVADTFGNFFRRHPTEIELPAVDGIGPGFCLPFSHIFLADKAFAVRFEHELTLPDKSFIFIQAAMLYTTFNGERRIRVHTLRALVTTSLANVFRHADLYSVVNLSMRQVSGACSVSVANVERL